MDIKPLASGSSGNAYLISDGQTSILIECGIPYSELQRLSDFKIPTLDGCLISHSHGDHACSVKYVLSAGVDCYMSKETAVELGVEKHHRCKIVNHMDGFHIGSLTVRPLEMEHDVYCLGFLIWSNYTNETLFFATDTYHIKYIIPDCEYIMIETNYDLDILHKRIDSGEVNESAKHRLVKSHQSIDTALLWLKRCDLTKTKRIYLLHLSDGSSNESEFKRRVVEETGVQTIVC